MRSNIERIKNIYFTPPKDMHDFAIMRVILAGYGASIRYSYMTPHRDFYRTKLYVSVPEGQTWVVKKIIGRFGGRIEEKEILVTRCYRGLIATHEGFIGYPIGVCGDWLVGVDLPCRLVVAGEKNMCLALMKYLLSRYFLDVGNCCFVMGERTNAVGAVSDTIPIVYDVGVINTLAEALGIYYNMSQNTSGIAKILLRSLGVVVSDEGGGEEGSVPVGREAEIVEWLLGSVRFGRFRDDVLTYDISGLSEGHKVIISVYLANIMFPFIYGVSDNFLDFARHETFGLRFVYYSSVTNVDRLYSKSQANYIIVLTRSRATMYIPYKIGDESGLAELGFVPLWRLLK